MQYCHFIMRSKGGRKPELNLPHDVFIVQLTAICYASRFAIMLLIIERSYSLKATRERDVDFALR